MRSFLPAPPSVLCTSFSEGQKQHHPGVTGQILLATQVSALMSNILTGFLCLSYSFDQFHAVNITGAITKEVSERTMTSELYSSEKEHEGLVGIWAFYFEILYVA